jgi:superfamily II DNA or RNA helicase
MISDKVRNLKDRYRFGKDNIGRDFVGICLAECCLYRRGTGFFSSSALKTYIYAIDHILKEGTKIEILSSPSGLDRKTIEALKKNSNPEKRKKTIQEMIDKVTLAAAGYQLNQDAQGKYASMLLSYLIAKNLLEIRFAIPKNKLYSDGSDEPDMEEAEDHENNNRNMYHVKNGYFKFAEGEFVAFDGSFNESDSGHQHNGERTLVFRSWVPGDHQRGITVIEDIDEEWDSKNEFIEVFQLSDDAIKKIKEMSPDKRPKKEDIKKQSNPEISYNPETLHNPEPVINGLRPYQNQALKSWKDNQYQGILAMATGTGKTKTAIYAISKFIEKTNGLVVITAPYIPLANQWIDELNKANISTITVFSEGDWRSKVEGIIESHISGNRLKINLPILVCVNKTFQQAYFQNILRRLDARSGQRMIVVDECHHFNKINQLDNLPESFQWRMGLSATPYEENDTKYLDRYFKKIVFEYSVKEGIDEGYLCPYIYHPIFIEFSQEEASSYIETVNKLAPDKRAIENNEIDKFLESIVSKLTKFQEIVKENITKNFTLFYCGEGYISFDGLERIRQLDAITMLLEKLDWRVGRITSEEKKSTREKVLKNLREKNLDAIASMRILDEGIDVPDCRYAYILASQRSERQAIQRRGRILRTSPGKINAELYDFIITGPKLTSKELENLYSREIKRAILFATDATNRDECLKAIYEV